MILSPLDGTRALLPLWMTEEQTEHFGNVVNIPRLSLSSLKKLSILLDKDLQKEDSILGGQRDGKKRTEQTTLSFPTGRGSSDADSPRDSVGTGESS